MRKYIHSVFFLVLISVSVQAQRASYFRRLFVDAEYYLLYEDYKDALPLYLELHTAYPNNTNISYRIGYCYINIPHQKLKAIPFFEKAIKAITQSYMEGYFTETQAPREALLYYGKALRIANDFDKAKEAFNKYIKMLTDKDANERELVNRELNAIAYAQQLMANPVSIKFASAGRTINTQFSEINPVISADTSVLVYTSVQQFYNAILQSNRRASVWSHPMNLNAQLFADGSISTVGISADGKTLLLARNDNDILNLYSSTYDTNKDSWGNLNRLPKEINSKSWENYASFSPSADTIYFSSNRPGGKGGFDIYMSVKTISGWSEATNLSDEINSSFDEIAPTISHDGKKIFFSSNGYRTMGGLDIYVSQKVNGRWTKPINLKYPINTTDDDIFFFPIGDGSSGYISRVMPQSYGGLDIYRVDLDLNSILDDTTIANQTSNTQKRLENETQSKRNQDFHVAP